MGSLCVGVKDGIPGLTMISEGLAKEQLNFLDAEAPARSPELSPELPAVLPFYATDGDAWITPFLEHFQPPRLSRDTLLTYVKHVRRFIRWWKDAHPQAALTQHVAHAYHAWLNIPLAANDPRPRVPHRTQSVMLSSVRRWGAFLVARDRLPQNPFDLVRGPNKADDLALGYLTEAQALHLLQTFPQDRLADMRDYLVALLMLRTGARETELCDANIEDVHPVGEDALLQLHSKGKDKQEPVVLRPDVRAEVDRYLVWRTQTTGPLSPGDPLFAKERNRGGYRMDAHEIRRRFKRVFARADLALPAISTLSLRQTAAIQALMGGAELDDVQKMMRHTSIETTKLYKKKYDRIKDAAERALDHLKLPVPATRPALDAPVA